MATHEESIEVNSGLHAVYHQWSQFETFRYFMEGVVSVTPIDDTTNRWVADVDGARQEFDVEITERIPDQRIAWRTLSGPRQAGAVNVYRIDDDTTRVVLQMVTEGGGDDVGGQLKSDLVRFKDYLEASGDETGAWLGFVDRSS